MADPIAHFLPSLQFSRVDEIGGCIKNGTMTAAAVVGWKI